MIKIGIDAVTIERFNQWSHYKKAKLERIFSQTEIAYCLSEPQLASQRFAARFAAKEAFFKAVSSFLEQPLPFLSLCKLCETVKATHGMVHLEVKWPFLPLKGTYQTDLSLTHTENLAIAVVLITKEQIKIY